MRADHVPGKNRTNSPAKASSPARTTLPWFRLYHEFSADPNVQSISFEDQRHFVVLMCLKAAGVLDRSYPSAERRDAVIARGLSLSTADAESARSRLHDAGLLVGHWQPKGWEVRQYESDSSRDRQRRYRERTSPHRHGDGEVTAQDADTEEETDTEVPTRESFSLRSRKSTREERPKNPRSSNPEVVPAAPRVLLTASQNRKGPS